MNITAIQFKRYNSPVKNKKESFPYAKMPDGKYQRFVIRYLKLEKRQQYIWKYVYTEYCLSFLSRSAFKHSIILPSTRKMKTYYPHRWVDFFEEDLQRIDLVEFLKDPLEDQLYKYMGGNYDSPNCT